MDCIEHGYFLGRDTLALMAARGVEWSPTLAPIEAHAADPAGRNTRPSAGPGARIAVLQREQMRLAGELGVRLVLGSDAGSYGVPHAEGAFLEMHAWLAAGWPRSWCMMRPPATRPRPWAWEGSWGASSPGPAPGCWARGKTRAATPCGWLAPAWRSF